MVSLHRLNCEEGVFVCLHVLFLKLLCGLLLSLIVWGFTPKLVREKFNCGSLWSLIIRNFHELKIACKFLLDMTQELG